MEYNIKSVVPIIETKYSSLTQIEKIIADFFINNKQNKGFSSKSISKELFVSEASLSRFAKNVVLKDIGILFINIKKV